MSNNNEENKNNIIINKRKTNSVLKKRMESKNKKIHTRCNTLENSKEKEINLQPKSLYKTKRVELSKSCTNFYNNNARLNFENEKEKEKYNDNNNMINLNLKKDFFVPRITRHRRNLNKFLKMNNDNGNDIINNKYNNIKSSNNNNFTNENQKKLMNKSHHNFNKLFNKKKQRCISTEANTNNNPKYKYYSSTNANSVEKTPKGKITNLTYSIEAPNYVCNNCYNKKLIQDKDSNLSYQMNNKELLANKFINENPFYFVDQMNQMEKKRIQKKLDNLSTKQRLALSIYEKEINKPRNLKKEKLQLINEYSLNPLAIYHLKDPKFIEQKKVFDKKEKLILNNPEIYQGLGKPRKAFQDYYEKCMYQVPQLEEIYKENPVYKQNYIRTLRKQIEDKKIKEKEIKKSTKIAEFYANKIFNEYTEKERLNDLKKIQQGKQYIIQENNKMDGYKKNLKEIKDKEEKKYLYKLDLLKDRDNQNIRIRNKKDKELDCEMYQKMFDEMNQKREMKINNEKEEKKKWNNYLDRYNLKYNITNRHSNCDICNKPIKKNEKLKKYRANKSNVL